MLRARLLLLIAGVLLSGCGIAPQFRGANLPSQHPFFGLVDPPAGVVLSNDTAVKKAGQESVAVVLSGGTLAHLDAIQKLGEEGLRRLATIGQRESRGAPVYALLKQENFVAALVQPLRHDFRVVGISDDFPDAFSSGADRAVLLDLSLKQFEDDSEQNEYKVNYVLIDRQFRTERLVSIRSQGRWSSAGSVWKICQELLEMRTRLADSVSQVRPVKN